MSASDLLHVGGGVFHSAIRLPVVLAQSKPAATGSAGTPAPPGPMSLLDSPMIYVLLIFAVFMIFSLRSSRNKQKQKQSMLDNMKRGDRVQTIGGILGTIVEARDKDVIVKVDESSNTKIKFSRGAIDRIVEEEKA
ncbi:MAG TPA: preprotein translocase subunit YajC [Tepidisphaeraceae bacterium]|nr:preprotein translocase subunit YajC [Tepidisphaeraceae bacterium]